MNTRIAIPIKNGEICSHFGHCEQFAIFDIKDGKISNKKTVTPPPHEPGSHPLFLKEMDCKVIICRGMGERAKQLFANENISVIVGAPPLSLSQIVSTYIESGLDSGENLCDH